ncbi:hypothetical protein [Streptomyces chengmaiensis]|uniref:hypothetical protein n=1 Tax=Streptomyces chengmaiensis TaxID=3040919 RepID=UPI00244A292F|nr:hypothetical protein [Streptomyces chengmaiensis]
MNTQYIQYIQHIQYTPIRLGPARETRGQSHPGPPPARRGGVQGEACAGQPADVTIQPARTDRRDEVRGTSHPVRGAK